VLFNVLSRSRYASDASICHLDRIRVGLLQRRETAASSPTTIKRRTPANARRSRFRL
jgi:hypothetical protein